MDKCEHRRLDHYYGSHLKCEKCGCEWHISKNGTHHLISRKRRCGKDAVWNIYD